MLHLVLFVHTHVPTYCESSCCIAPHNHKTSQVVYVKGSGGLQVKMEPSPFQTNEIIDVDCVFRDKIDQSTYDIYIGCGTCNSNSLGETALLFGYQDGVVEPFTQTSYHSIFPKDDRKFNTTLLVSCTTYFTIHLIDYKNRTNNDDIVWAAVIGLGESFTASEILSFPVYILRNHGYVWNELGFTYPLFIFVGAPIFISILRMLLRYAGWKPHSFSYKNIFVLFKTPNIDLVRSFFYEIATIGFVASSLEELTHLVHVQAGKKIESAFYIGLFGVVMVSNMLPLLFVHANWYYLSNQKSTPKWAPLEIVFGFAFLFLLGSGFYIGPSFIMLSGMVRVFVYLRFKTKNNATDQQMNGIQTRNNMYKTSKTYFGTTR